MDLDYWRIYFLIIIIVLTGGEEKKTKIEQQLPQEQKEQTQPQVLQEQQTQDIQESKIKVQQEILIPVKKLINKTPSEIEEITGQKLEIYGKKPSGKLMSAGFTLGKIDVDTVYTLLKTPKVKYNGTILLHVWFDNPIKEFAAKEKLEIVKERGEKCSNYLQYSALQKLKFQS